MDKGWWQEQLLMELRAIHKLLQWQKEKMLQRQQEARQEVQDMEERVRAENNRVIEEARKNALEDKRQIEEEFYQEHIRRYHQPQTKEKLH